MTFLDLLRQCNVEFREQGQHHHVTSGWLNVDCIYCSPNSNKFRLGYNIRGGYLSCWSCGSKRLSQFVMDLTGFSYPKVKHLLTGLVRDKLPPELKVRGKLKIPDTVGDLLPQHVKYLRGRGFKPDKLTKLWDVKGIGRTSHLGWRIFIPIYFQGEIVSWTTRAIGANATLRYRTADAADEKINHHDLLYGEDYTWNTIIVVEGPLDVWKIGPGAVCTCGTAISKAQVLRMAKYPKRYICFDSEPNAQRKAQKLSDDLSVFDGQTFNVVLESGKDPGEAKLSELKELQSLLK